MTESEGHVHAGRLYITPAALAGVNTADLSACYARHCSKDWGDLDPVDARENCFALDKRLRILSVYHDRFGVKFWIITDADRRATTVLLPEDY